MIISKFFNISMVFLVSLWVAAGYVLNPSSFSHRSHEQIYSNRKKWAQFGKSVDNDGGRSVEIGAREARIITPLSSLLALSSLSLNIDGVSNAETLEASVHKYFPGALTNSLVAKRVNDILSKRDYYPTNTLQGPSMCSSKISNDILSKDFRVGGVLPFLDGSFDEFTNQCPDNGKILISFGPSVKITDKVDDEGNAKLNGSSSSLLTTLNAMKAQKLNVKNLRKGGYSEYVEGVINQCVNKKLNIFAEEELRGNKDAIVYTTNKVYDMTWDLLRGQITTILSDPTFGKKINEISFLGGIAIDCSSLGEENKFQPLMFRSLKKDKVTSLYKETFGDLS